MKKYDAGKNTPEERATPKAMLGRATPPETFMDMLEDPTDNMMKYAPGIKQDKGKLRLDLIDPVFMEFLAIALGYGADKYDDHNWLKGMHWSRVYGALLRHLRSWYMGEDIDRESGNHHLAHAAAMLMFLVGYVSRPEFRKWDDRMFVPEDLPF